MTKFQQQQQQQQKGKRKTQMTNMIFFLSPWSLVIAWIQKNKIKQLKIQENILY